MLKNNNKEILNWDSLKEMLCPKCAKPIVHEPVFEKYVCLDCNFKVSEAKFDKIVNARYRPKFQEDRDEVEDNLSALSEL